MSDDITLYHNPRCSKSREALALLQERGIEPDIVLYLDTPPSRAELAELVRKLGIAPHDLIRTGEAIYKSDFKGKPLDDDGWLEAMVRHPKLIERPIAIRGKRAIIGRPPQNVLALLD